MPRFLGRMDEVPAVKAQYATMLTDPAAVGRSEVAWLYQQRWQIELDFRALKQDTQMHILRCKSPDFQATTADTHLVEHKDPE